MEPINDSFQISCGLNIVGHVRCKKTYCPTICVVEPRSVNTNNEQEHSEWAFHFQVPAPLILQ